MFVVVVIVLLLVDIFDSIKRTLSHTTSLAGTIFQMNKNKHELKSQTDIHRSHIYFSTSPCNDHTQKKLLTYSQY